MIRTMTADQVKENVEEVLGSPRATGDAVIVEDNGQPMVVLISPAEYEELAHFAEARQRGWEAVDRIGRLNAHEDPDDVLKFVTSVVEEVREERDKARRQ